MAYIRFIIAFHAVIAAACSTRCVSESGCSRHDGSLTALIQMKTELSRQSTGAIPSGFFTQDADAPLSKPLLESDSRKSEDESRIELAAYDVGTGAVPLPPGFVEKPSMPFRQLASEPARAAPQQQRQQQQRQHQQRQQQQFTALTPTRRPLLDEEDIEQVEALKQEMDQHAHQDRLERLTLMQAKREDKQNEETLAADVASAISSMETPQIASPYQDPAAQELNFVLAQGDLAGQDARHRKLNGHSADQAAARAAAFAANRFSATSSGPHTFADASGQQFLTNEEKLAMLERNLHEASESAFRATAMVEHNTWEPTISQPEQDVVPVAPQLPTQGQVDPVQQDMGLIQTPWPHLSIQQQFPVEQQAATPWQSPSAEHLLKPVQATAPKDMLRKDVIKAVSNTHPPAVNFDEVLNLERSNAFEENAKLREKNAQLVLELEKQQHQIQMSNSKAALSNSNRLMMPASPSSMWRFMLIGGGVIFAVVALAACFYMSYARSPPKQVRFWLDGAVTHSAQ
eukprot:gnl/TRDRNA2_/TRDRNA2_35284_c0_seq1.p1 gnl/TRDRNA2_/TRDRNA2_35284_c0~~gnl/TRDRNA2_/TRDRNA2_35284_c0_seq1.p1  ORF type:complete len:523 (+),score=117.41 gnl/TRDRNA2_/TRDRNA2_35284_c0_seq1:22-1569(+)